MYNEEIITAVASFVFRIIKVLIEKSHMVFPILTDETIIKIGSLIVS